MLSVEHVPSDKADALATKCAGCVECKLFESGSRHHARIIFVLEVKAPWNETTDSSDLGDTPEAKSVSQAYEEYYA